ncbi:MAG: glutathione S-transferase family protein [Aliidongia sp.]
MTGLKIYGVAASRAFRVIWCAEELGLDYESIPIHFADGSAKTPDYLALNPNGKIPTLVDGDFTLWESMAMTCYLARKHSRLWPNSVEDEGLVLQWSFWAISELEKHLLTILMNAPAFAGANANVLAAAEGKAAAQKPLTVLNAALGKSPYLVGADFTVADINVASLVSWATLAKLDLAKFPHITEWYRTCMARPAAQRAAPKRV